jgi:hydroxymethylpyrimidine pyrophosphatase-like HAD family hydrolase
MWFFRAVAFDLDGTLAVQDSVSSSVLAAVDLARVDRSMLLVTGRTADELDSGFPGLAAHFDAVVTENGAVVGTTAGQRLIGVPIDDALEKALAVRGVACRRGQVLLGIDGRDAAIATEVITQLGLDYQVVHNRMAAMILPAGVTKGSGLRSALTELGLSAHNTVAVGDAENDLALLQAAEVGVAVRNAVPALLEHADQVLDQPNGTGVSALLTGPLLRGHQRVCPARHWVRIGSFADGTDTLVPGSQGSVLICGDTGAGKSYLAGLLAERWIDAAYTVLVIDPEGDHVGLAARPGVHLVDARVHLPPPNELLATMRPNHASMVLDLSGLDLEDRLAYLEELPGAIGAERTRYGVPHWVIHDEAREKEWRAGYPLDTATAEPGTCLVTWQPDRLPAEVRQTVDVTLTVAPVSLTTSVCTPMHATLQLSNQQPRSFAVDPRVSVHVRHRHKYAAAPLAEHRRFYFHTPDARPAVVAASLDEFSRHLRHCDLATLEYHLSRGDFSRWMMGTLADQRLSAELSAIERDLAGSRSAALEHARQQTLDAIERRYLTS